MVTVSDYFGSSEECSCIHLAHFRYPFLLSLLTSTTELSFFNEFFCYSIFETSRTDIEVIRNLHNKHLSFIAFCVTSKQWWGPSWLFIEVYKCFFHVFQWPFLGGWFGSSFILVPPSNIWFFSLLFWVIFRLKLIWWIRRRFFSDQWSTCPFYRGQSFGSHQELLICGR